MRKKKFFLISIAVIATFAIVLSLSLAWFLEKGDDKKQELGDSSYFDMHIVGGLDIRPIFRDESKDIDYIAPGANIAYSEIDQVNHIWRQSPIVLYNRSSIETELRIKLDYTYIKENENLALVTYSPTQDADFEIEFFDKNDWEFEDDYWYYRPGGNPIAPTGETAAQVELIKSIGYSHELVAGNVYENEEVEVNIIFEAKQAYYGTWTQVK